MSAAAKPDLRAPFPWFGGKRRIAPLVWERFGNVPNYVEPFAGSLAVLLGRPGTHRVETINDKDAYVANFWRAVQADAGAVARFADYPVNESDLHARHVWLVTTGRERVERLTSDPEYFDVQVAGWWVWGLCLWIGSGWCEKNDWRGRGIHSQTVQKLPHIASRGAGKGGHSRPDRKRPAVASGNGQGAGVHRVALVGHQLPQLSGDGSGAQRGALRATEGLYEYMDRLQQRLRRVRVCCGDWARIVGPAVTTCIGVTGVLLDPPYPNVEREDVYRHDDGEVWHEAKAWAIANGDDPKLRIAFCGYEGSARHDSLFGGEDDLQFPESWSCVPWKATGGYGRSARGLCEFAPGARVVLAALPHSVAGKPLMRTWPARGAA